MAQNYRQSETTHTPTHSNGQAQVHQESDLAARFALSSQQKLELYYWMRLTRTYDDMMVAYWRQGRGLGGVFSQRGHEAISVGSGYALEPDDVVAPMHRDLGCYFVRGMAPRRASCSDSRAWRSLKRSAAPAIRRSASSIDPE